MRRAALGKSWADGEVIVRQGEVGNSMFVVQAGEVEVLRETEDGEVRLAILGAGDFFGEMSIFEHEVRSATVRARGKARVLTVDKRTLLKRIKEDPFLAEGNGCQVELIKLDAHLPHDRLGFFDGVLLMNVIQFMQPDRISEQLAHFQSLVVPGGIFSVEVFTVDDPHYREWLDSGVMTIGPLIFEHPTRKYPVKFFDRGELASYFGGWEFIHYHEGLLWDKPHGIQTGFHQHGLAQIIARKKIDTLS